MKISIIIPVYNEKCRLPVLLQALSPLIADGHEIIVVDGGSTDQFILDSSLQDIAVLTTTKGRAMQMNKGAQQAKGDVFWFLHADSQLLHSPLQYIKSIGNLTEKQWGRFNISLDGHKGIYRIIEWMMNKRSAISGIATGDQGIFIHRQLFNDVGCFSSISIMEDIDISVKLKKISFPNIETLCLQTSSRRWEKRGAWRTIFLMWKMRWLFFIGVDPNSLVKLYESS